MPLDPKQREIARWLDRARIDIRAAEVDLEADALLRGDAAFHCQQAVEKALKALLTRHDHVFEKTHDLQELAVACLEHEPALRPLLVRATPLTPYAWRFRYPGNVSEPTEAEVDAALKIAREVVRAVENAVAEG